MLTFKILHMKQFYIITLISFLSLNSINSQTVTVDNATSGALATYTFTYVTSYDIGVGTNTPNIIYLTKPSAYTNFIAVNPLSAFAPYAVVKVNGIEIPINTTNFGSIYGSWSSGIQISTGGASGGSTITAGSTIEVTVSNIITNPTTANNYTFTWRTAQGSGAATQNFQANVDFSSLSTKELKSKKNLHIFPNPSSDYINVSGLSEKKNYKIYNVLGTEIAQGTIFNEGISIKNLTNGVYFLKFDYSDSLKFIKQ